MRSIKTRICIATDGAISGQAAGFERYGRGSGHPAGLNYGDCFTYGLAKLTGEPVLFKGDDFSMTDLTAAAPASSP